MKEFIIFLLQSANDRATMNAVLIGRSIMNKGTSSARFFYNYYYFFMVKR